MCVPDAVEVDGLVPGVDAVHRLDLQAVQVADDREQPFHHAWLGEPGLQLFLRDGVLLLAQFFRVVRDVPGLHVVVAMLMGVLVHRFQLLFGRHIRALCQVFEEADDLVGGVRHLGGQRAFRVIGVPEQARSLVAQTHDLFHGCTVVVQARGGTELGGARDVGGVQLLAQLAVIGVGHHGVVGRELQGEHPAVLAALLCGLLCQRTRTFRQAGELCLAGDVLVPGVGCIQHVVAVFRGQPGEFLHDLLETIAPGRVELDAGQAEIAQGVVDDLLLRVVEAPVFVAVGDLPEGLVQALVLAEFGAVLAQQRQAFVVDVAQCLRVDDRIHVADRRPGTVDAVVHFIQRFHQVVPGVGRVSGKQLLDQRATLGEQPGDGGFHVFRPDLGKMRQAVGDQQGVGHSLCSSRVLY